MYRARRDLLGESSGPARVDAGSRTAGLRRVRLSHYTSQFYDITNVFWRSLDPWCAGRCDAAREVYGKPRPYSAAAADKASIFAADDEVDDAPEDAAFLCWADLDDAAGAVGFPHHRRP